MTCSTLPPPKKSSANQWPAICARAKPPWLCCTRWSIVLRQERGTIESVLSNGGFNGITPADIVAILNRHGSIDAAYARAVEFSNKAREAICTFPDSEIKRVLLWVPEFVVEREN